MGWPSMPSKGVVAKGKKRGSAVRQVEYAVKGYDGSKEVGRKKERTLETLGNTRYLEEEGRTLLVQ